MFKSLYWRYVWPSWRWLTRLLFPAPSCAGKLGNCTVKDRFHSGCLSCRWRKQYYGKWTPPPYWINYTMTWNFQRFLLINRKTGERKIKTGWWTVEIDPRGHFTRLRCAAIMVCDKILTRIHARTFVRLEKPWVEVCMFVSSYPTF